MSSSSSFMVFIFENCVEPIKYSDMVVVVLFWHKYWWCCRPWISSAVLKVQDHIELCPIWDPHWYCVHAYNIRRICVCVRDKVVITSNPASVISKFIGDGLVLQMSQKFMSRTDLNIKGSGDEMREKSGGISEARRSCMFGNWFIWSCFLWSGLVHTLVWKDTLEKSLFIRSVRESIHKKMSQSYGHFPYPLSPRPPSIYRHLWGLSLNWSFWAKMYRFVVDLVVFESPL